MEYIQEFTDFDYPERDIYAFLSHNLMLGNNIDSDIKEAISQSKPNLHLEALLNICIKLCRPYLYHSVLNRLNIISNTTSVFTDFERITTAQSNTSVTYREFAEGKTLGYNDLYFLSLKKHIAVSFYYSWKSAISEPIKLHHAAKTNFQYQKGEFPDGLPDGLPDESTYISLKYRQTHNFVKQANEKYKYFMPFLRNDMEKISKLRFPVTDSAFLLALIGQQLNIPYANKYRAKPYTYRNFLKFLSSFLGCEFAPGNHITNSKTLYPYTKVAINNYLTERMLHFDLISFIIKKYNKAGSPTDSINYNKFMTLGELASLPNVFSRICIARGLLLNANSRLKEGKSNDDSAHILHAWIEAVRTLVHFLTKCTFPILNLTFKYIMEYYIFVCLKKPFDESAHIIDAIFEAYFKNNDSSNRIYRQMVPFQADSVEKRRILVSTHSKDNTGNIITDPGNLCVPLSKLIFFDKVMTPTTLDTTRINYKFPFTPDKVEEIQIDRINYLMNKAPILEYVRPFKSSDIVKAHK